MLCWQYSEDETCSVAAPTYTTMTKTVKSFSSCQLIAANTRAVLLASTTSSTHSFERPSWVLSMYPTVFTSPFLEHIALVCPCPEERLHKARLSFYCNSFSG
eukprot:gnl/TRDRNA2_/TRDRNA2_165743_c1_seq2.p2 gnl/TRDRNA2_/TRDRNA2_165743_c1~~gnl/TRDRNA2_/TRDRNA2_165743_c1_seq2.p2  ORF type:complete len:102 (-),score=5.08 gnl/TRDRNA2_/TRDRNA2_165743_c1_seq2:570-875(-)